MIERFEKVDVVCVPVSLLFRTRGGRVVFFDAVKVVGVEK